MGFPTSNVTTTDCLISEFICPICVNLVEYPIQTSCSHLFCRSDIPIYRALTSLVIICRKVENMRTGNLAKINPRPIGNLKSKFRTASNLIDFGVKDSKRLVGRNCWEEWLSVQTQNSRCPKCNTNLQVCNVGNVIFHGKAVIKYLQHTSAASDLKECNPLAWRILQRVQVRFYYRVNFWPFANTRRLCHLERGASPHFGFQAGFETGRLLHNLALLNPRK